MDTQTIGVKIQGTEDLKKTFERLSDGLQGDFLETATRAGALPVLNQVRITVPEGGRTPYKAGDYRKSFEMVTTKKTPARCEVQIGTDRPQARRLEFGFVGRDTLGRFYNQAPRPHIRPAFDENVQNAQNELRAAMEDLLRRVI